MPRDHEKKRQVQTKAPNMLLLSDLENPARTQIPYFSPFFTCKQAHDSYDIYTRWSIFNGASVTLESGPHSGGASPRPAEPSPRRVRENGLIFCSDQANSNARQVRWEPTGTPRYQKKEACPREPGVWRKGGKCGAYTVQSKLTFQAKQERMMCPKNGIVIISYHRVLPPVVAGKEAETRRLVSLDADPTFSVEGRGKTKHGGILFAVGYLEIPFLILKNIFFAGISNISIYGRKEGYWERGLTSMQKYKLM